MSSPRSIKPEGEIDDLRVPLRSAMRPQLFLHLLGVAGALVELPRRHDLDRVGDGDDAGTEGDLVARETVRVPGTVPAFVMVADDRPGRREQVERLEERVADLRVRLDDRALLLVERPRLEEDTVGDADLADVVEDRAQADRLDLVGPQPQQLGDADGQRGEPLAVTVEGRVARLDRVGEGARERRREQPLADLVAPPVRALEGIGDRGLEVGVGERLGDEAGRAARQRLAERLVGAGARDEDDRKRGAAALHHLEQLEAREARHDHVAHDEVEVGGLEQLQRALRAFGTGRVVTGRLEYLHDQAADHLLVVDHEDVAHPAAPLGDREPKRERRAVPVLRRCGQRAAVRLGDSEADRQAEAGPAGEALRREEGLEDALERVGAIPGPSSLTTAIT